MIQLIAGVARTVLHVRDMTTLRTPFRLLLTIALFGCSGTYERHFHDQGTLCVARASAEDAPAFGV